MKTVGQLRVLLETLKLREGASTLVQVRIPLKDIPPQMVRLAMDPPQPPCEQGLMKF